MRFYYILIIVNLIWFDVMLILYDFIWV